jgi:excisionase family DNA binding protein
MRARGGGRAPVPIRGPLEVDEDPSSLLDGVATMPPSAPSKSPEQRRGRDAPRDEAPISILAAARADATGVPTDHAAAPGEPEVLTVPELAVLLRVNEKSMYELVARGRIPGATHVGRLWRVHRPTVVAWLAGQISAPRPKGGRR